MKNNTTETPTTPTGCALFDAVRAAGLPYDSHGSDLYIPDTKEAREVWGKFYPPSAPKEARPVQFTNQKPPNVGKRWLCFYFQFPRIHGVPTTNIPEPVAPVMPDNMPKTGEKIVWLTVKAGETNVARSSFTVRDRTKFSVTASEYIGSDGCRHHMQDLYPAPITGGPSTTFPTAAAYLNARECDAQAATGALRSYYVAKLREVAEKLHTEARDLEQAAALLSR